MTQTNQMSPRMRFFFSRVFPLLFILVGALTFYFGVRGLNEIDFVGKYDNQWYIESGAVKGIYNVHVYDKSARWAEGPERSGNDFNGRP